MKSYLKGRTQTTSVGGSVSNKDRILCGVPQGLVLGKLLFLLYINDIYTTFKLVKFHIFADNTNILYANKNIKTLISTVNSQLLLLQEWLATNKLTLNFKKSNFVIFHHYRKTLPRDINIKMFDNTSNKFVSLESKKFVKYLGLLSDKNLISIILAIKLVKKIGLFAKLRHYIASSTLLMMYKALVQPYL